jgi:hypothetical protein
MVLRVDTRARTRERHKKHEKRAPTVKVTVGCKHTTRDPHPLFGVANCRHKNVAATAVHGRQAEMTHKRRLSV